MIVLCPGLGTAQGHHCHMLGRSHPSKGLWCPTRGRSVPSWGSWCLEKGTEGELCPRAGAACSLCFCSPLPLGALQETQQSSTRPQGPPQSPGIPPVYWGHPGAVPVRQIPLLQAGDAPWCDPKPQGAFSTATRGCPTALGPQAPWSTAHLDRAALLPALLRVSFQHLKEEQESPELNSSRVLELGQPRKVEGMPGVFPR